MTRPPFPAHDGPRHSPDWYRDQVTAEHAPQLGDRMLLSCEGGPSTSRLETFPPRLEIEEQGGIYVLEDDGPPAEWVYRFLPLEP